MTDIAKLRKELGDFIFNRITLNDSFTKMDVKIVMDKFTEMEQYYQDKIEKLEKENELLKSLSQPKSLTKEDLKRKLAQFEADDNEDWQE